MQFITCLCFFISTVFTAYAIEFRPMSVTFDSSERNATQSFQVTNPSLTDKAAVRISIADRIVDPLGNESYEENSKEFTIYPPQTILAPGETQTIRATWIGDRSITSERAYRIIAEQLPVNFNKRTPEGKAMIQLLMRFIGAIYVTPPRATAAINLDSSFEDNDKGRTLIASFTNNGTRHAHLHNLAIYISPTSNKEEKIRLSSQKLIGVSDENILAGHTRTFSIPLDDIIVEDTCTVTFSYNTQ